MIKYKSINTFISHSNIAVLSLATAKQSKTADNQYHFTIYNPTVHTFESFTSF